MFRNILFVFVGGPLFLPLALAYLAAVVVAAVAVLRSVVTAKKKEADAKVGLPFLTSLPNPASQLSSEAEGVEKSSRCPPGSSPKSRLHCS